MLRLTSTTIYGNRRTCTIASAGKVAVINSDPQQVLPLAKVALEAHALRDLTKLLAGRGAPSLSAGLMRCYLIWLTPVTTAPGNIFMTSWRA